MDLVYNHPTNVHLLRACAVDDACDLIAVGGDHAVDVLVIGEGSVRCIASFHIGSRVTALAWCRNSVSPSSSDNWSIELAAAGDDFGLYLLNKEAEGGERVFSFGGGLSGHHGRVNEMGFCGGWGEDSTRYVATVGDDKMLMVWDLHPTIHIHNHNPNPNPNPNPSSHSRPQPTAYVIPFSRPLTAINPHPSTSKQFLVADARGSVFVTDWRSDPDDSNHIRHSATIELVDPHALVNPTTSFASVAWRPDSPNIIAAVFGSRFSIWDLENLRGGKPFVTGISFPDAAHRFRWSPTYPEYFAISTRSPAKGALIHVHNINYIHAQPTVFAIRPCPHSVHDFDFLAMRGIPRIAAAVGTNVHIFTIGTDS